MEWLRQGAHHKSSYIVSSRPAWVIHPNPVSETKLEGMCTWGLKVYLLAELLSSVCSSGFHPRLKKRRRRRKEEKEGRKEEKRKKEKKRKLVKRGQESAWPWSLHWEAKAGGSGTEGHSWLCSRFCGDGECFSLIFEIIIYLFSLKIPQ